MDLYLTNIDKLLRHFGEKDLKVSDEFLKEAKDLAQGVFRMLQTKSKRFTVAEPRPGGSIRKKTEVLYTDLDLVVVVNGVDKPPFTEALDDFEQILDLNYKVLKIVESSIQRGSKYHIAFKFENGIEVDLLPAANKTPKEVYDWLEKNPDDSNAYSTTLADRQIKFMTSHESTFLHSVIRLLKFWLKSLSFGGTRVIGGSTMMELIGIAASEKEEESDKPSTSRALLRALQMIIQIDTLKLAFEEVSDGKWVRVAQDKLSTAKIPTVIGTRDILNRKSFIVEPANPFNDLLAGYQDKVALGKLQKFAKVTRDRLEKLRGGSADYCFLDARNILIVNIVKLFEPQPASMKIDFPTAIPDDLLVTYAAPSRSIYPDLKVQNERIYQRKEVQNLIQIMKWKLNAGVHCTLSQWERGHENNNDSYDRMSKPAVDCKTKVEETVKELTKTNFDVNLGPGSGKQHENMDVTLTIPYQIGGNRYAVKYSMTWKH